MIELDSFEIYDQLTGSTSDADRLSENRYNNCLASCVAMVINRTFGYKEYADSIKDRMRGDGHVGNLFVHPDGTVYLSDQCNIPVQVYHQQMEHNIRLVIEQAIQNDFPVCVLFSSPIGVGGKWVNHFGVVFGYDENGVIMADPWGGKRAAHDWASFERTYLRWAIVCQRGRDNWLRNNDVRAFSNLDDVPVGGVAGQEEE